MLVVHKIIDGLRGFKKYAAVRIPGVTQEDNEKFAKIIEGAEKFDFGEPPMEAMGNGRWELPQITKDEMSWWREGLIPLPAPLCYFEFTMGGTRTAAVVTDQEPEGWLVWRIDLTSEGVCYDACMSLMDFKPTEDGYNRVRVRGNIDSFKTLEVSPDEYAQFANVAVYFALMLNSRTTEKRVERASKVLSQARVRRGRSALSDHTVVRIVPKSYLTEQARAAGGSHAPPRLHWRRSHLRHYDRPTPNSKWSDTIEYQGRKGWHVAVIPRVLVGKEELGKIDHTYWVPQQGAA